MKKVFLIFLFLFISFDLYGNEILPAENILSQLKYKPDWDNQPTTKEIIDAFEKDTGWNYSVAKEKCIKPYRNIGDITEQEDYDCVRIQEENISLKQTGDKLSCKRKDFVRSVILNGSGWLLERDWPKYVYDDWYYELKSPFYLDESKDDIICKAFSEKYGCLYDKHSLKSAYEIQGIFWDFDVAKSRAEIEFEQNNENESINNNAHEKRNLCSNFLYLKNGCLNEKYKLKNKNIKGTRLLEIDIDNDGKNELIHLVWEPDNTYGAVYDKNIDRIKRYLKNKRLIIKNEEHYLKIARKLRGRIIKESRSNDSPSYFYIPNFNINFLKINNRIYIYYNTSDDIEVITITNDKIDQVCQFSNSHLSKYGSNFAMMDLKKRAAEKMNLYYVNGDNYLYDKSLLEEIRNINRKLEYDEEDIRKLKQILYDNANKVCNIDLYKLEKEQKKSQSPKEILSKLKYKPDWNSYPSIDDFRKTVESLEEKILEKEPHSIASDYRQTNNYKEKRDKITHFHDYYDKALLLREYYDDHIYYDNRGKQLACKRKDFFRSIVLDGSYWLLDRDWSKETYDDWFYNLRFPFVLGYGWFIYGTNDFDSELCNAFAKEQQCLGSKEITGETVKSFEKIKKYNWDYNVIKTEKELELYSKSKVKTPEPQKNVCLNYFNQDQYDVYSKVKPLYTEDFFSLRTRTIRNSKIIEIDFNNDGKKELIYLAYDSPKVYSGVFFDNVEEAKKFLKTSDHIVKGEKGFKDILKKFNGLDITDESYYFSSYNYTYNAYFSSINPYVFDFFKFKDKNYFYFNDKDYVQVVHKNKDNETIGTCLFEKRIYPFDQYEISYSYVKKLIAENIPLFHLNNDEYFYAEDLLEEVKNLIPEESRLEAKDYLFDKAQEICGINLYELEKEQREVEQ